MKVVPQRDEFMDLAANHDLIGIRTEVLADRETPVGLFEALAGAEERSFLLESVEGGDTWARWSFAGWDPLFTVLADDDGVHTTGGPTGSLPAAPLSALDQLTSSYRVHSDPGLPPLHSGLVGYLSYDIVREIEELPNRPEEDRALPAMVWQVVGSLAAFDRLSQRITLIRNVIPGADPGAAWDEAVRSLETSVRRLANRPPADAQPVPDFDVIPEAESSLSAEEFSAAVERAIGHIEAGDAFQIVPSIRFEVRLEADPFDVYRALRLVNPSPYMFYFRHDDMTIAGSSPELMVRVREGRVHSRPIAGTRRRGSTPERDAELERELLADPKERAEHVMLVDLARNDIGRVAEYGSVVVDELMVIERYSHVMHIVSGVSGHLRPDVGPVDVLRATFPHGTVTGAPKVRAMSIIDDLEPVARGPYAGAVGYLDFSGNIDTAIALRTMVARGNRAWVQAGAGVVADSDPEREYRECIEKATAVLAAIGAAERV